uniref:Uncharacterized protein n=1 Tax=Rhizophora mucronata TaxID=61149 RepID=A0A2P2K5M7_RHIMU
MVKVQNKCRLVAEMKITRDYLEDGEFGE